MHFMYTLMFEVGFIEFKNIWCSFRSTAKTNLGRNVTLLQSRQVRVWPGWSRPRPKFVQFRCEVKGMELIVHELSDIPGKVVVPGKTGLLIEMVNKIADASNLEANWTRLMALNARRKLEKKNHHLMWWDSCTYVSLIGCSKTKYTL